jgi:hypothetical protein
MWIYPGRGLVRTNVGNMPGLRLISVDVDGTDKGNKRHMRQLRGGVAAHLDGVDLGVEIFVPPAAGPRKGVGTRGGHIVFVHNILRANLG